MLVFAPICQWQPVLVTKLSGDLVLELAPTGILHVKSLQSCPTLRPRDCNLPGHSVRGILQARILEWVVMPSFRDLGYPGIKPVSLMPLAWAGRCFTTSATWEAPHPHPQGH